MVSEVDRDELRRLLGEAELPWTIEQTTPNMDGPNWLIRREGKAGIIVSAHEYGFHGRGEVITAVVNALPDLLDALEKADTHRDSLAATLIEVQREKRLLVERVREMHYPADNDPARTPRCEECQGRAGTHPCGCWADEDRQPVCGHCNAQGLGQRVPWPCPTIQALDGGVSDVATGATFTGFRLITKWCPVMDTRTRLDRRRTQPKPIPTTRPINPERTIMTEITDEMVQKVAEALAGVTITDPDFYGLEREDWRKLAAAALKTAREHDREGEPKAPEGADLAYLSDRARAYIIGLEARLKTLRQENDELRAKLADPSQRDEKAIKGAYTRGWSDCAAKLASKTQTAMQSLTHCHDAALAEYTSTPGEVMPHV